MRTLIEALLRVRMSLCVPDLIMALIATIGLMVVIGLAEVM